MRAGFGRQHCERGADFRVPPLYARDAEPTVSLLVRMLVTATTELLDVAEGRLDGFRQPSAVRKTE